MAPVLATGLLLHTAGASAQGLQLPPPDPRAVISVITENDSYSWPGTDRWYTNGFRFGWSSAEESLPSLMASLDRSLADVFGPARSRWGLALGQNMYTPSNKQRRDPNPLDRPYAGYAYLEASLDRRTANTLDRFSLQIGMVGPAALARPTQDFVHQLIGDRVARGWSRQLPNEPTINLFWDRIWRTPQLPLLAGIGVDALPSVTLAGGTVATYAEAGLRVRIGQGLERDFGPPRIRPAIADSPAPVGEGFGWYVFAGAGGRVVARDMFLDGTLFRSSRSVDHRTLVGDLELGVAVFWHNVRLSFTQDWRSREFEGQRKAFRFGSFSLAVAF